MEIVVITEQLFKDSGPIKEATVVQKFIPYLLIAQKLYIAPILGEPLLEELQTAIKEASKAVSPVELTPEMKALVQQIAPALSFYAVYQGLPFHWAALVNKGVTLLSSDNSEAVSINDIAQLRNWVRNDAEILAKQLLSYLKGCSPTYPKYACPDDTKEASGLDDFGFSFPKRRKEAGW